MTFSTWQFGVADVANMKVPRNAAVLFPLLLTIVTVALGGRLSAQSSSQLYFDQNEIVKGLSKLANPSESDTVTSTIDLFTDPERKRILPPGNDVTLRVEALVPVGKRKGQYLSQQRDLADAYKLAKQGLTASYTKETGKLTLTFKRPFIFTDPRPGSASRTWDYEVGVSLTIVGSGLGGAGGVKVLKAKECISLFGIKSQKDEKQWKPARDDHYTYIPEIEPKEFLELGGMDTDAIFSPPHLAVFKWRPNTEGKSIRMRWQIKGDDVHTFEDVTTDWETANNPCCGEEAVTVKKAPQTPPPQALPPIKESDIIFRSSYVARWERTGKGDPVAKYDFAVFLELTGSLQATQIMKVRYVAEDIGLNHEQAVAGTETGRSFALYYSSPTASVVTATVFLKDGRKLTLQRNTRLDETVRR